VLVTGVDFGDGRLNGVALARMVKVKRPDLQAVFVASLEDHPHQALVDVVRQLLVVSD
jgi:hypothetical protein